MPKSPLRPKNCSGAMLKILSCWKSISHPKRRSTGALHNLRSYARPADHAVAFWSACAAAPLWIMPKSPVPAKNCSGAILYILSRWKNISHPKRRSTGALHNLRSFAGPANRAIAFWSACAAAPLWTSPKSPVPAKNCSGAILNILSRWKSISHPKRRSTGALHNLRNFAGAQIVYPLGPPARSGGLHGTS
jgi:hypothetical protein